MKILYYFLSNSTTIILSNKANYTNAFNELLFIF